MPWASSSERALKGQGSREDTTSVNEAFVKDSQNGKREQSKKGIQGKKKKVF